MPCEGSASGFGRLLRVPYSYAVALMLLNLFIVGWLAALDPLPLRSVFASISGPGALGASIKVGEFNQSRPRA